MTAVFAKREHKSLKPEVVCFFFFFPALLDVSVRTISSCHCSELLGKPTQVKIAWRVRANPQSHLALTLIQSLESN